MNTPRVGIISHTLVQQHHLRQIIDECGFEISVAWLVEQLIDNIGLLEKDDPNATDIWLVDIDTDSISEHDSISLFEHWLFALQQPVIFGEGSTLSEAEKGFQSWVRQLQTKLMSASSHLAMQAEPQNLASSVWVLAASTGGPEAVKTFLDCVPAGLGVAFMYAQHIEAGQHHALANSVARASHYTGRMANHGDKMIADTITVVPSNQELRLLDDGTMVIRDQPWRGEYCPSIDQMVASVADCFGAQSGVIFFSGMGDDGMAGARLMGRQGGQVWVQSIETCTSPSMPGAVQQTGIVTKTGSPKQLASNFKAHFNVVA